MKRYLPIIVAVCVCLASFGTGIPTTALLMDTGSSGANTAEAGVLDLKLSEVGPATRSSTTDETQQDTVRETIEDTRHGSAAVSNTLQVDNTKSTLTADHIGLRVSYTESDRAFNIINVGAERIAESLTVATFTYQGTSLLGSDIRDENGNGHYDIDDLTRGQTRTNLAALSGIQADSTADIRIAITRNTGGLGSISEGGDGIEMALEINGSANSLTDSDSSVGNTIRYA